MCLIITNCILVDQGISRQKKLFVETTSMITTIAPLQGPRAGENLQTFFTTILLRVVKIDEK